MMNRNERMEKLENVGVDTKKYFSIPVPNGLKPGSTISVVIDENGNPIFNTNNDIRNQIIKDGYVRNTKLHRRFVMAHMFRMLNYNGYFGSGYTFYLNNFYTYDYSIKMMIEEIRVLSKLEVRDKESFDERSIFFTKDVVLHTMYDYVTKLIDYINTLPVKHCKGIEYKKIAGKNIFVSDIRKKIICPINNIISNLEYYNRTNGTYNDVYHELYKFMKFNYISLPSNTKKDIKWIDAYKGNGAYYTLKNLIMYHNCKLVERPNYNYVNQKYEYTGVEAMEVLKKKRIEYQDNGWKMLGLLKETIKENNFDFNKRMKEIYSE